MEKIERLIFIIVCCIICMPSIFSQGKNSLPPDIPTIEALIDAHKSMQKQELRSLAELGSVEGTTQLSKSYTDRISDIRNTLNTRMADVNSWLRLTSSVVSIGVRVERLVESYADFTKYAATNVTNQPLVIFIYTKANEMILTEIKRLTEQIGAYTGYQTNILKATSAEKEKLLNRIRQRITSIQMIINRANRECRRLILKGLTIYTVYDLFKSNKSTMNEIIESWKENCQR